MSYCTGTGTSNWPLRGGKHTLWEGGVRGTALIHSRSLLPHAKGTPFDSLMHVSDWVPTIISMCSVPPSAEPPGYKIDGVDQWSSIVGGTAGPRKEGKRAQSPLSRQLLAALIAELRACCVRQC